MAYSVEPKLRKWTEQVVQIQQFSYLSIYNTGASDLILKVNQTDANALSNTVPANGGSYTWPVVVATISSIFILNPSSSEYQINTDGIITV
jgi:hypothetical protein